MAPRLALSPLAEDHTAFHLHPSHCLLSPSRLQGVQPCDSYTSPCLALHTNTWFLWSVLFLMMCPHWSIWVTGNVNVNQESYASYCHQKFRYQLLSPRLVCATPLYTLVSNAHFPNNSHLFSYWFLIFPSSSLNMWGFLGLCLDVYLPNDIVHVKSGPKILFPLKRYSLLSKLYAPVSICECNDFF